MASFEVLNNLQEIKIESPVDKIIQQIRQLISSGQLNPGDKLPPERKLAEGFGVGRSNVRYAIQKLEFYGILKTLPQSGTIVAGMGITALEGLISDVLKMENSDFASLVETRVLLEAQSAYWAAKRCSTEDLADIKAAAKAYELKAAKGKQAVEEDLIFHLAIAEASKNSVLKSLMLVITPDIISSFIKLDVCKDNRFQKALEEHSLIVKHITDREPGKAADAMREHLQDVMGYSRTLRAAEEPGLLD